MARRNLVRSLFAASLMVVPFAAALVAAPAPAVGAESPDQNLYAARLSEKSGFTPGVLEGVRVGDWIAFVLDMENSVSTEHSVTFDDLSMCPGAPGSGRCWPELRFNDPNQSCSLRNRELPYTRCFQVLSTQSVRFHDQLGMDAGGPDFQGLISMAASSPPTTTPTTAAPTTTTTAGPTTTSSGPTTTTTRPGTTTTVPPTTATTAPSTIRPLLITEPPTTTTTASGANVAGSGKNGTGSSPTTGAKDKDKDKDKGKNKGDSSTSTTDTTVVPDALPLDAVFDSASLTPGPVTLPDSFVTAGGSDGDDLEAAVMGLLDPEESDDDDGTGIVLMTGAALGLLVLGGGLIAWFRRSSRYFPA